MTFTTLCKLKTFSENFLPASKVSRLAFFVTVISSLPFTLVLLLSAIAVCNYTND